MKLSIGESFARILAVAIALLMVVPAIQLVGLGDPQKAVAVETVLVHFDSETDLDALRESGMEILETYDTFVLARTTNAQNELFQSKGLLVQGQLELDKIHINSMVIDTLAGEPDLSPSLMMRSYPSDVDGHYLVQFHGPVKEEWKHDIERLGGRVLNYIPNNAFIVQLDTNLLGRVKNLREVQWMGIYQPAYKIRPLLLSAKGEVDVKIIVFKGEDLGQVISSLHKDQIIRYFQNKEFGVVKARVDANIIPSLARLNSVQYIEPIYEMRPTNANMQWVMQTDELNNRRLWDMGLHGEYQLIGVADTGLDFDHNFFRQDAGTIQTGDVYNVTDLGRRKVVRYQVMSDWVGIDPGTDPWAWKDSAWKMVVGNMTSGHGTMVSGTLAGNDDPLGTSLNDGIAKGAKIYLQDIGTLYQNPEYNDWWDDSLRYIPDDYHDLFWDPYNAGVRIHSNSWGAKNIDYDLEAMMVDRFMWEYPDMLIVYSTGNEGLNGPGSPATAKSCISVGWHDSAMNQDRVNSKSSVGPTQDGRRKPTVMAIGSGFSSRSSGDNWDNLNIAQETPQPWSGTSYSGPVIAGLAAMTRQYYMEGWYPTGEIVPGNALTPSNALLKSTIVAAGQQMQGTRADRRGEGTWPNNAQGWGRVVLDNALYFPGDASRLHVVDHKEGLATGEVARYSYYVASGSIPFKVVMAYSDYPGATPTTKALVNNLDLTVTSPTGQVYLGNVFWTGKNVYTELVDSKPNFGSADVDNPLEGVLELTPEVGFWTVEVKGTNVPAGPQPFALTILGATDPDYGQLFLDKATYGDSDTINIRVEDLDAISPVVVKVTSDTETAAENVTLLQIGTGVFEGTIDTAYGIPTPDGVLQVSERDAVTVEYVDVTPPEKSVLKTAVIDGAPPMITNVKATTITNAAATIVWNTDESATSTVYYGTSPAFLNGTAVKLPAGYFVSHSVDLVGLSTGVKYYFDVESTDRFGHTTLDNNAGQHYSFVTTEKAELLLVIGDATFPPERVERYRNAFDMFGWSFNEWYVERSGIPSLSLLQGYKVVLWQTGLEEYPPFEPQEMTLITNYLDEGGRLFISSHDVAWAFAADSGSEYATVQTGQWVNSTLKADWDEDPRSWTDMEGEIGDPISNEYVGVNRIPYIPHRNGGAGDEVTGQQYGGASSSVWKDYGGPYANGVTVGIKWVSSGPNGTAGPGNVWGGQPSKIVDCFFEITGLNFISANDWDRGSVINKTIVWLIGHDHPDVQVISPNGGEVFSGNTIQIDWSRNVYSTGINQQTLYYSPDDGQSWTKISPDPAPGDTTYTWDVTTLENGINYRVKVMVQDDGNPYPMLNGSDVSDGTFTILKPSGDNQGPVTIPGSIVPDPNPVDRYTSMTFTAMVDDTNFGNSTIQAAEFYIDAPGAPGGGTPMNPVDAFDSATEGVTWTGSADWPPGTHCIYVHGQDAANNWGQWESRCFLVHGKVVAAPSDFMAELTGLNHEDVTLTWTLSPDDPTDVSHYSIYYGAAYDPTAASYAFLTTVPNQTSMYVHAGAGLGGSLYYAIYSNGTGGDTTMASQQAGKFVRTLSAGIHLVSIPITPSNASVNKIFQTLEYDKVWTYDSSANQWQTHMAFKPYGGDLTTITLDKGYWVEVTQASDFIVAGWAQTVVPIQLMQPWTLAGYPSLTGSMTVGELKMLTGASKVEGYTAAGPYFLQELADSYVLAAGEAYWIGNANLTWQVYI
ncbi:MAG: S8 family serine peptidase [Thermoplasmata archaeon]